LIHIAICDDEKHMSDHIKTMAYDYLVKPVDKEQFENTMERCSAVYEKYVRVFTCGGR
jgi:response regulator of citrate/malate metabolism